MGEATYAVIWRPEDAAEALTQRRIDLGISFVDLDHVAGQAAGTAAKYLGPSRTKMLGIVSLVKLAAALGLRVVFEIDHARTAEVLDRVLPRQAKHARERNYAQRVSMRVMQRVQRVFGMRSARERAKKIPPTMRSAIARHAALRRWYADRVYDWDEIKRSVQRKK